MDDNLKLSVDILDKVLSELMPDFIIKHKDGYSSLLSELEVFQILTVADLKDSIKKHLRFVNQNIEFLMKLLKCGRKLNFWDNLTPLYFLIC